MSDAPLVKARADGDPRAMALEVVRASGLGLLSGHILLPTHQLVALVRKGAAKAKLVESIDLVPGDGDARLHVVLQMGGSATRVVVRIALASFYLSESGGALRFRFLESPSFAGKNGGRGAGLLGMLGAFGSAALNSMGPEGIVQTVAEFLGPPLSARGDLLTVDLGGIPALQKALLRDTPLGRVGELVNVTGARFKPTGLEITVKVRPRSALSALRSRFLGL